MNNLSFGPTEMLYLVGLAFLTLGVSLAFGIAWGSITLGTVLLGTAFLNAAQREPKIEKGK